MDKVEKVKAFSRLYELVNYYYDYRDQPVKENFNFFEEVKQCCDKLDIDFEELKKEFKFNRSSL